METSVPAVDRGPSADRPVRVFIVNDHELARNGLSELLECEGFAVVGATGLLAEAVKVVPVLGPDVVIVDDRFPNRTTIEICRALRAVSAGVRYLILTGWDDQRAARAAVLAGASGYVLKQVVDNGKLLNGIRAVAAGRSLLSPGVRAKVAEGLRAAAEAGWMNVLTGDERSVLVSMTMGLTNRRIGQELGMPSETVDRCVSMVSRKLGFGPGLSE